MVSVLVATELALQVLAVGTYLLVPTEPAAVAADGVLCVGDSFTFGSGATDSQHSYPAVLQEVLGRRYGWEGVVTNCGRPGQNSADAYHRLQHELEEYRPAVVCIMLGCNDGWSRPAPVEDVVESGFRWEWRTGRLLKLLFQDRAMWANDDADAAESAPDTDAVGPAVLRLLSDAGLQVGLRQPVWPKVPGPVLQALREIRALPDDRQRASRLRALLERYPDQPAASGELVKSMVGLGKRDEAAVIATRLAREYGENPSLETGIPYAFALHATGDWARLRVVAGELVDRYPNSPRCWRLLASGLFVEDSKRAASAYRNVVELAGENAGAGDLVRLARLLVDQDLDRSALFATAGVLRHGIRDAGASLIALRRAGLKPEDLAPLRTRYRDVAPIGWALSRMHEYLFEVPDDGYLTVLRANLARIDAMVRRHGGRSVLLSYPRNSRLARVLEATAHDLDVAYAPVFSRFLTAIPQRGREDLFVADGHCSDAGYRIVAEVTAEVVRPLLSR